MDFWLFSAPKWAVFNNFQKIFIIRLYWPSWYEFENLVEFDQEVFSLVCRQTDRQKFCKQLFWAQGTKTEIPNKIDFLTYTILSLYYSDKVKVSGWARTRNCDVRHDSPSARASSTARTSSPLGHRVEC